MSDRCFDVPPNAFELLTPYQKRAIDVMKSTPPGKMRLFENTLVDTFPTLPPRLGLTTAMIYGIIMLYATTKSHVVVFFAGRRASGCFRDRLQHFLQYCDIEMTRSTSECIKTVFQCCIHLVHCNSSSVVKGVWPPDVAIIDDWSYLSRKSIRHTICVQMRARDQTKWFVCNRYSLYDDPEVVEKRMFLQSLREDRLLERVRPNEEEAVAVRAFAVLEGELCIPSVLVQLVFDYVA
jgi:hypothetical protein